MGEDDCKTGKVGERELVLVVSQVLQGTRHDAWMMECFRHTICNA